MGISLIILISKLNLKPSGKASYYVWCSFLMVESHSPNVIVRVSKTTWIGQLLIESHRKLDFTWK